jgi:hypothetical protein
VNIRNFETVGVRLMRWLAHVFTSYLQRTPVGSASVFRFV